MQSRGGVCSARVARQRPIRLFLSGPAAGVVGARESGQSVQQQNLITVDIGGTSSDIALIANGELVIRPEGLLDGFKIRVPMVDVNSIGSGGGSIAWIDAGGGLRVGPQSAGSEPGPACYGHGGADATVTDASIVLGLLNPAYFAGGTMQLDPALARKAVEERVARPLGLTLEQAALGIHRVVNVQMAEGIRLVSISRGIDPRSFTLVAFGGAGALHATALARELDINAIVVPRYPGVLCASGLLSAMIEHEASTAFLHKLAVADPAGGGSRLREARRRVRGADARGRRGCIARDNQLLRRHLLRRAGVSHRGAASPGRPRDDDPEGLRGVHRIARQNPRPQHALSRQVRQPARGPARGESFNGGGFDVGNRRTARTQAKARARFCFTAPMPTSMPRSTTATAWYRARSSADPRSSSRPTRQRSSSPAGAPRSRTTKCCYSHGSNRHEHDAERSTGDCGSDHPRGGAQQARRDRQRDAADAPAQRLLADRQGGDGLLGGALHRRRPDYLASDRDSHPPGDDDPRARGGHRQVPGGRNGARRRLHPQRSVLRRNAPARHHAVRPGDRRRLPSRFQRRDGASPGRRRHDAGLGPDQCDRDLPGGLAYPAAQVHRGRRGQSHARPDPPLQHPDVGHVHGRPQRAARCLHGRGTPPGRAQQSVRRRTTRRHLHAAARSLRADDARGAAQAAAGDVPLCRLARQRRRRAGQAGAARSGRDHQRRHDPFRLHRHRSHRCAGRSTGCLRAAAPRPTTRSAH